MNFKQCTATLALLALAGAALAHSGGLDSHGCHHDRKNGGYHCHGGSSVSSRSAAPSVYSTVPTRPQAERPVQIQEEPRVRPASSSKRAPQVPQIYYPSATQPAAAQTGTPQFFFSNCQQARAVGKTVLRTVEEGYRPELDGNRNGVACEPGDTP